MSVEKCDLSSQLDEKSRDTVQTVYRKLSEAGHACYVVGGAVRDMLLGRKAVDIDITTDAEPQTVRGIFRRTAATGMKHGTITVLLDDTSIEVTTFRSESTYSDARRPDSVIFSKTLSEDLSRRDFTINALAWDPGKNLLIDEHDGRSDLNKKIIRTIGNPRERFFEDGLRTIRACRFCATLEFSIEDRTYQALCDAKVHERVRKTAVERFSDEIWKGLKSSAPSRMIRPLEESGLRALFFGRAATKGDDEERSIYLKRIEAMPDACPELKMACWWMGLGICSGDSAQITATQLKISSRQTQDIIYFIEYIQFQKKCGEGSFRNLNDSAKKVAVRKFLSAVKSRYRSDTARFLSRAAVWPVRAGNPAALGEILSKDALIIADLEITGEELIEMGFQGKQIGDVLRKLLDQIHEFPDHNEKKALLQLARSWI